MLTLDEIIKNNCDNNSVVQWWPKFAYHYTDLTNAVNIIKTGFLYSRVNAEGVGLMQNNNASRQVIDMTKPEAMANVRFYFRPKTPTQYYNEGFKHPSIRYDGDTDANVPVPIFFLFKLENLLSDPKTGFANGPLSGNGSQIFHGVDAFSKLDFQKIYSTGPHARGDFETHALRQAELIYPSLYPVKESLALILCRNDIERNTLLKKLLECGKSYYAYKDIIKVCRTNLFENNGLCIIGCHYHNQRVVITFSDSYEKKNYTQKMINKNGIDKLDPIGLRVRFEWKSNRDVLLHQWEASLPIDYAHHNGVNFNSLPQIEGADFITIHVYFEDCLMCISDLSLKETEML